MPIDLDIRPAPAADLTDRQRSVLRLVEEFAAVAGELPSAGYLARRLSISRRRAWTHLDNLRRKGWCRPPARRA